MIASLKPQPLLETVSTRLAALLDGSASWVILLDEGEPRLVTARGLPPEFAWNPPAYALELQRLGVLQLEGADLRRLHPFGAPWQTLVIIPLALESRVLGGICLPLDRPLALAEDDRRALLAFAAQAALALEHARLFEELRHKQDELIRSSKLAALGTFSAGIAHEFNNLLAGVLGFAQLGLMSEDVADKDEALEVAVRSCLRGRSITGGLLTFARRGEPQRGLHQLREIVEETLELVERELAKLNIRIERRFQPVPQIVCDPGQISQVVLNLITNARDAMVEQNSGVITIDLAQRGDQIELRVGDTGTGIPEELLDQVFHPFMTTKGALGGSTTPGTGLGLSISYGIIESHGGTITIKSALQRGTTVTIRLPINSFTLARVSQPVPDSVAPLRILLVDDDQVVGESLARLLEAHGHRVVLATDGETALRRYHEQLFDLVISDIVLSGMGGVVFVRQVRMIDPQARVLVITGQAGANQTEQVMRAGAFEVLSKPFVIDDVLAIIARSGRARQLAAVSSVSPAAV
jgi:signal transduction histidine kinase/CheY-like chemotaxis protein